MDINELMEAYEKLSKENTDLLEAQAKQDVEIKRLKTKYNALLKDSIKDKGESPKSSQNVNTSESKPKEGKYKDDDELRLVDVKMLELADKRKTKQTITDGIKNFATMSILFTCIKVFLSIVIAIGIMYGFYRIASTGLDKVNETSDKWYQSQGYDSYEDYENSNEIQEAWDDLTNSGYVVGER